MAELDEILQASTYRQVPGEFIYAKLSHPPKNPASHFMVSFDQDEITVVTKIENYESLEVLERNKDNYALFELRVSIPFYAVGFLAKITSAISAKGANILVVSTYSKDYILVRTEHTEITKQTLHDLGIKTAE